MKNQPGYPLPDGELGDDDIVCQLVFLPDRPEYWQAFLGALSYMSTWRAWERDDDKRGKDAAANWREAYELTMECWRMACLDELQDNVAEILAIMQLGNSCCDEQDITDGDRYTDRVVDGEDDVPQNIIDAGYASGTSDWDGFDDYKCMIAHVTVDQLEARLREIQDIVDRTGPYLAIAAALSAITAVIVATGGLVLVFGLIAGVGTVSALYYALTEFGSVADLADDVATNHDELVCAIYEADGDVGSLIALNDKIDELFSVPEALILKNMNMGPTLKALYAGRYDEQDIADTLLAAGYDLEDFSCSCDVQSDYFHEYIFDGTCLGFSITGVDGVLDCALTGNLSAYQASKPSWGYFYRTSAEFVIDLGEPTPFRTVQLEFDYRFYTHVGTDFTVDEKLSFYINTTGGYVEIWHKNFGDDGLGEDEWGHAVITGVDLGWWESNNWVGAIPWRFRSYALNAFSITLRYEINNLKFYLNDGT
jgi:hypothetical protein